MKTFDEIVKWVRKNVPKEILKEHKSVRDAAKWFVAYKEAMEMRDSMSIKDWAHLLIGGLKPLSPAALIEEWAEAATDDRGMQGDAVTEAELKEFFGVK